MDAQQEDKPTSTTDAKIMEMATISEELSEKIKGLTKKMAEQAKELETKIAELSHLNEAETGFNPTAAELASEFEGIKAEIEALG